MIKKKISEHLSLFLYSKEVKSSTEEAPLTAKEIKDLVTGS